MNFDKPAMEYMLTGRDEEAFRALKNSLRQVSQAVDQLKNDHPRYQKHKTPAVSVSLRCFPLSSLYNQIQDQAVDNEKGFIFNKAFYEENVETTDKEILAQRSARILYNMALSLHRIGLRDSCEHLLQQSLELYVMSLQVLDTLDFRAESSVALLYMAVLTNIACIHAIFDTTMAVRLNLSIAIDDLSNAHSWSRLHNFPAEENEISLLILLLDCVRQGHAPAA